MIARAQHTAAVQQGNTDLHDDKAFQTGGSKHVTILPGSALTQLCHEELSNGPCKKLPGRTVAVVLVLKQHDNPEQAESHPNKLKVRSHKQTPN